MKERHKADSAEKLQVKDRPLAGRAMTMRHVEVNGIKIAFDIRGSGPRSVLIMGYRLSSRAWQPDFIEALAERFTVVLFDNRGTGLSDKPTFGYELSNMAKDVCGLLDHLRIVRANVLGYSMGGAIAQELVCQRLQPLRYLHDCSDCFRLERLPGGACTPWKAPPLHGAHPSYPERVISLVLC